MLSPVCINIYVINRSLSVKLSGFIRQHETNHILSNIYATHIAFILLCYTMNVAATPLTVQAMSHTANAKLCNPSVHIGVQLPSITTTSMTYSTRHYKSIQPQYIPGRNYEYSVKKILAKIGTPLVHMYTCRQCRVDR